MATEISPVNYLTRSVDRNRYFYGKLMTVRDFLREQEYFNSKRWLINRLLFGSGIVCGLEVAGVGGGDSKTVAELQPGVAFDPLGREITVSERARHDLAKLVTPDLPPGGTAETNLLVCLEYHECPKEPVPSLGGSPCDEVCESNRVGETYTVSLLKAPEPGPPPTPCESWLNRQTVRRPSEPPQAADDFLVHRVAPVWVRAGEVFEVALKVTALRDVMGVVLNETAAGGTLVEPNPQPPTQFPTTPVSLRRGEFFVYVYQVQAPPAPGTVQLLGGAGVPTPQTVVQVLDDQQAKAREAEMRLGACPGDPPQTRVPIARIRAAFTGANLTGFKVLDGFDQQRFRYSLSRVAELLDCVRASLRAEAESPRPGHLFITFKDLERNDLQPIGPAADHGRAFTVPRGDHVHALLFSANSGLLFEGNRLRIEGDVGGEKVNFLKPVSGQNPAEPQHLTTKHYVDSRIAGLDWQESVITRRLFEPPEGLKEGDRFLVAPYPPGVPAPTATKRNPWPGNVGKIATWDGQVWDFAAPDEGTAVFVEDENIAYLFVEGKWIPFLATPEVAAGAGLRADGARLSVGQGPGLKVNENDVEVVYEAGLPQPVGPAASRGGAPTAARGDHTHALPLARNSGLAFGASPGLPTAEKPDLRAGLHINGLVGGANIDFLNPVWGRSPTEPRHLATKEYVDGLAAGLDWQNSVLDKDLTVPPRAPNVGARYLVLHATGVITIDPRDEEPSEMLTRAEPSEGEARAPGPIIDDPGPGPLPEPLPLPDTPWTGHDNSIAAWDGQGWDFTVPNEGMAVFVEDENTAYLFVDGRWVPFMAMPSVAAGAGLRADGARLSVGQGSGLRVNENDVEVVYHSANPAPVGGAASPGASASVARGDHTHKLPLALSGGLVFEEEGEPIPGGGGAFDSAVADERPLPVLARGLRVSGQINSGDIDFLRPVSGQEPLEPRHLATKQYVDGVTAGLTWQSTVLDKDLSKPPDELKRGARYLLFVAPAAGSPWDGNRDSIATWNGKEWKFIAPTEGMATFVADENLAYLYADGRWVQFLAPPAPVGAGAGLFRQGTDLAVGRGEGIIVLPDAVSVNFGANVPPPVGEFSHTGFSRQAAQSDHTHQLPLAPSGGLEFIGTKTGTGDTTSESASGSVPVADETNGSGGPVQLRVNGQVSGQSIDFLFPVFGQSPTDPRHLATKQYVDSKGLGAVAGNGLVSSGNILSVGNGPGLVVGPDEVRVNFETGAPRAVSLAAPSPGAANTVARGDHVHAMPDVWGTSVATGVVAFNMRQAGQQPYTSSFPIDPGLGAGPIAVVVGLVSEVEGEGVFVGDIDRFEAAMFDSGFRRFPSVLVGAAVLTGGDIKSLKNTTFEIWAKATEKAVALPELFRVRWWAYKVGRDQGTIDYTPGIPVSDR